MQRYPLIGLEGCRPLSDDEVAELSRASRQSGGIEADISNWIAPTGHRVFGHVSKVGFESVSRGFLERLRLESHIFSDDRLSNLLGETSHAHWNDDFSSKFDPDPESEGLDWCVKAFKQMTRWPERTSAPPLE